MANRKVHVAAGAASGLAVAYCRSEGQLPADRLYEIIGGFLGGCAAARFADLIDVPTSPNHRSHAHSAVVGIGIAAKATEILSKWETELRQSVQHLRNRRANAASDWERMSLSLMEILLLIAVGMLSGVIAGHLSHLVLDMPRKGLPLI